MENFDSALKSIREYNVERKQNTKKYARNIY